MGDTVTVRETIHHGNYRNVREQVIPATMAGIRDLLAASPYNANVVDTMTSNPYVMSMAVALLADGYGEFGWASYELVEKNNVPLHIGDLIA
jgi:hypothetical protein